MELIEKQPEFVSRFSQWSGNEELRGYPFVENKNAPFTPVRRALPMMNLALISSAGAYIDGTEPFKLDQKGGDHDLREIPIEFVERRQVVRQDAPWLRRLRLQEPSAVYSDNAGELIVGDLTPSAIAAVPKSTLA